MKTVIKLIIGIGLIVLLVSQLEIENLSKVYSTIQMKYFVFGFSMFFLATIFEVIKLYSLLHRYCSVALTIKIVFVGLFVNNFLPSNIGGDIYKVYMLKRLENNLGSSVVPIILDRITGIIVLVMAGVIYSIINYSNLLPRINNSGFSLDSKNLYWVALVFLLLVFFVPIALKYRSNKIKKFINGLEAFYTQAKDSLAKIRRLDIVSLVFASLLFHLCRIFGIFFFICGLNAYIEWESLFLILAVVALVSVLPISIGALGVRESLLTIMLVFFGVEFSVAIMVALIVLSIIWMKSLIGGLLFLSMRN